MDYSKITLGEMLSSENETIKRNAIAVLKVLQKGKEIDIYNVEHPARKKAIRIIEEIIEDREGKGINGEEYYGLEDRLTEIIA